VKSIIMVGGGIQQVPAVKRLQAIGYTVIVSDKNHNAPAFSHADLGVCIGATDVKSLISWVLINKVQWNISGIFTLTNYAVSVSLIANACGLPSIPVDVSVNCDNKLIMKRLFQKFNFKSAPYFEVSSIAEAEIAYKTINGPAYLKVVDGFGGKGVVKIRHIDNIKSVFSDLLSFSCYPTLILEKEIIGDYIDVQGVYHQNIFHCAGEADSFFTTDDDDYTQYNPVENFNICPSQLTPEIVKSTYQLLDSISQSLGMTFGPVGGDFVVNEDGIHVIEVGPRLHGPNGTLQIFPNAMAIKPLEYMAQVICGDDPNSKFLDASSDSVSLCMVITSPKKTIKTAEFIKDPLELPGIFASHTYKNPSDTIEQQNNTLSGLASLFVNGKDLSEAKLRLDTASRLFNIQ
jgi:biotin carboxylase